MRHLMLLMVSIVMTGCVAKSSYVNELAQLTLANSKAIVEVSPTPKNLETVVLVNKLASEDSSAINENIVSSVMGVIDGFSTGGVGGGVTGLLGLGLALYANSKKKKALIAGRKSANEPDPEKANKFLDEVS